MSLNVRTYVMHRYAYGALLESAALVIDQGSRAAYLLVNEDGDGSESTVTRPYAAQLLALWRRDARRTSRMDAPEYLGHDDSDRPRLYLARQTWAS